VSGDVVVEDVMDEEEEWRVGLNAVLRRRREPVVERRGVKDWKRFVRLGEGILAVGLVECCWKKVGVSLIIRSKW
jgi:hypothetical protein